MYTLNCTICDKPFETVIASKRVCSFECKQEKQRECSRRIMRELRNSYRKSDGQKCSIPTCGWNLTIDLHHEKKKSSPLCPNHHSLITRNAVKDIEEIIQKKL